MIAVIGGGPAGSYTSYLLAKEGYDVTLIEEHETIGSPVQCTGIVTHSIEKFFRLPKEVIANRCKKVVVVSKNKRTPVNVEEIVMWRNKFDEFVASMAEKEGVKILTGTKFISLKTNKIEVKDKKSEKRKEIFASAFIGADGPSSSLARAAGIAHNNKFYIGMQAKVKHKMPMDEFETHFGEAFPDFFGWAVPESEDMVRLGLGSKENTQHHFYRFLEKITGKKEICCWESGIIPIYNPKQQIQKGNVYLIGDSATQVKATTGGGIIPSLKAAHTLVDCVINKKNYNIQYKLKSGKELLLHLTLRNFLNKFKDEDYDKLTMLMGRGSVQNILRKYDRDTPIPLLLNLALKEPRLMSFAKIAFR